MFQELVVSKALTNENNQADVRLFRFAHVGLVFWFDTFSIAWLQVLKDSLEKGCFKVAAIDLLFTGKKTGFLFILFFTHTFNQENFKFPYIIVMA